MRRSEQINELAAALTKAQGEFPLIPKDQTAKVPLKDGKSYEYHYADLATILEKIRPALARNGLCVSQPAETNEKNAQVTTLLMHTSGQFLESTFEFNEGARMQETGASLTYLRRYMLTGILGIAAEEDDDAQTVQQGPAKKAPVAPKQKPPALKLPPLPEGITREDLLERLKSAYTQYAGLHPQFDAGTLIFQRYGQKRSADLKDPELYDLLLLMEAELRNGVAS